MPIPELSANATRTTLPPWAALLEKFYLPTGLPVPRIELLENDAVPQPYKDLLVHSEDMTPTLERFYQQKLTLQVLGREIRGESYSREVVLRLADNARAVEYGVIRIFLDHFPPRGRRRVLEEQSPLGSILQSEGIPHMSWPQAFFRTVADSRLQSVLELRNLCDLFGRRNVLVDGSRRLLAEVIEILACVDTAQNLSENIDERKQDEERRKLKYQQNGNGKS